MIPFILFTGGEMNKLYLITGPAGVGKSTISNNISKKITKSVLIEGDDIYNQFKTGRVSPWIKDAPLDLFWKNIIMLIENYLNEGYNVVFNYIINYQKFCELKKIFKDYNIKFVVLLTDDKTILKRDKNRPLDCQMKERCLIHFLKFQQEYGNSKYILDTTNLDIEKTTLRIINDNKFNVEKMNIDAIKTPTDILKYMQDNIDYGWVDIYNEKHVGNMKNFRRIYKTSSIQDTLKNKIGTCIEQVALINYLFKKINIESKMFCTRIYEGDDFNDLDSEEHMHCFILYYLNNKVYHLECANCNLIGIYEYENEEEAVKKINDYYAKLSGGIVREVTLFNEVPVNLTFKEFNIYINNLDRREYEIKKF